MAPAPPSLDLTTAAAVPLAALTAYQALTNLVNVQSGTRVLVNGASGGVGTVATQIAASLGAHITAVTSFRNTDWMKDLGAAETIDYTQTDFTQGEARYDVVFDCYGNQSYGKTKGVLTANGTYISTIPAGHTYSSTVLNPLRRRKSKVVVVQPRGSDLNVITQLIEDGSVRPIVDHVFERDDMHAAYEKLESKRAKGKIVVRLNPL